MKRMQFRHVAVAATCLVVLLSSDLEVAMAQSEVLEEVKVTARRRTESLQEVPASVTVFTDAKIDAAGINTPEDFINLTPNVTVVQVQNVGNSFVTIRGISQNRNTEPSVATLVDGVLMSNPAQFNQDLYDIQQIEVLRGPHGAQYGRNAIGGAILINTKEPTDELEGRIRVGADSGPGYKLQGMVSGPISDSEAWKFRAAVSYTDTDGYIDNVYLDEKADPYKDLSARVKFLYEPNDTFSADLRLSTSNVDTQALYYQIRSPLPEPFPGAPASLGHGNGDPNSVNDTSLPVRVNNAGVNQRDLSNVSLKLDWNWDSGTLTSITSYDTLEELLTGDNFDFLPIPESIGVLFGGSDTNQSQWFDIDTISQEIRFTSAPDRRLRWIAGAFAIATDRFVSTGQMTDTGGGVFPVYRSPRGMFPGDVATDPVNPSLTFLADSQDNFAWAAFGEIAYDFTDALEGAFSLRYDKDRRENTTVTPTAFLPNVPGFPQGSTGEVRTHTWDDLQPKVSLRYIANDRMTVYGSLSRGFRSGGFNQTGVGAVAASQGIAGVGDLFDAETSNTFEVGMHGLFNAGRLSTNLSLFRTKTDGTYFFIFLQANSTQNLGNLNSVDYTGLEFELDANLADGLDFNFGLGYTDSEITDSPNPSDIGDSAPNVSKYTSNVGIQYLSPASVVGSSHFFMRADYRLIGKTAFFDFEQPDTNDRDPVNLVDLRIGLQAADDWAVTLWGKNLLDEKYHTEYSTFGFVFKALPRRWGIEFTKDF